MQIVAIIIQKYILRLLEEFNKIFMEAFFSFLYFFIIFVIFKFFEKNLNVSL